MTIGTIKDNPYLGHWCRADEENAVDMMLTIEQLSGDVRELTYTVRDLVAVVEGMKMEKVPSE